MKRFQQGDCRAYPEYPERTPSVTEEEVKGVSKGREFGGF